MTDILFADISEWQPVLDDSYPYRWLSIRSNDGTYRDRHFQENWTIARSWLDSGRLRGLIVYCVYRSNWRDVMTTHIEMQGENRPDVVSMVDVESWGGQIRTDNSDSINRLVWGLGDCAGRTSTAGPAASSATSTRMTHASGGCGHRSASSSRPTGPFRGSRPAPTICADR